MEISGTIAEAVQALLDGWEDITIANDLQGIAESRLLASPETKFISAQGCRIW